MNNNIQIEIQNANETISEYDDVKKTIKFADHNYPVTGELINDFICLFPDYWAGRRYWGLLAEFIKSAAIIVSDFNPDYFLHNWSLYRADLYNQKENIAYYAGLQSNKLDSGKSITWLRNMAYKYYTPDENLLRGDVGLATLFVNIVKDKIKFMPNSCDCFMWKRKSRLWLRGKSDHVGNILSKKLGNIIKKRIKILDLLRIINVTNELESLRKQRKKVGSYNGSMSIVNIAKLLLEDGDFINKINLHPDLLPIDGGRIVNLQTGETFKNKRNYNFTYACPVLIDRDPTKMELVKQILLQIFDDNMINEVQLMLGQCLTGHKSEKNFIWYGYEDGKTILLNSLWLILSRYFTFASKPIITGIRTNSKITSEHHIYRQSRLAVIDDVKTIENLNDYIGFQEQCIIDRGILSRAKIIIRISSKLKNDINRTTINKKVKFIPFTKNPLAIDWSLIERMKTDLLSAFFTWILDGCVQCYKIGLITEYNTVIIPCVQQNKDIIKFIAEKIENDDNHFSYFDDLHTEYSDWCYNNGFSPKWTKDFLYEIGNFYKCEWNDHDRIVRGMRIKINMTQRFGYNILYRHITCYVEDKKVLKQSLGEIRCLSILKEIAKNHPIKIEQQWRDNNCKDKNPLPFDFCIQNISNVSNNKRHNILLIEVDGRQHKEFIPHFHRDFDGFERQKLHDRIKDEFAAEYNIPLLRIDYSRNTIPEDDIYNFVVDNL